MKYARQWTAVVALALALACLAALPRSVLVRRWGQNTHGLVKAKKVAPPPMPSLPPPAAKLQSLVPHAGGGRTNRGPVSFLTNITLRISIDRNNGTNGDANTYTVFECRTNLRTPWFEAGRVSGRTNTLVVPIHRDWPMGLYRTRWSVTNVVGRN